MPNGKRGGGLLALGKALRGGAEVARGIGTRIETRRKEEEAALAAAQKEEQLKRSRGLLAAEFEELDTPESRLAAISTREGLPGAQQYGSQVITGVQQQRGRTAIAEEKEKEREFKTGERLAGEDFKAAQNKLERDLKRELATRTDERATSFAASEQRRFESQIFKQLQNHATKTKNLISAGIAVKAIDKALKDQGLDNGIYNEEGDIPTVGFGKKVFRKWLNSKEQTKLRSAIGLFMLKRQRAQSGVAVRPDEWDRLETVFGLNTRGTVSQFLKSLQQEADDTFIGLKQFEDVLHPTALEVLGARNAFTSQQLPKRSGEEDVGMGDVSGILRRGREAQGERAGGAMTGTVRTKTTQPVGAGETVEVDAATEATPGGEKFKVGVVYTDAQGNKAKYLGGGEWEEQ